MTISVKFNDESSAREIMLIDHVNSETVRIPLNEVVDVINKMNKIHHAETYDRMSDDDKRSLEAEINEAHRKRTKESRELAMKVVRLASQ